MADTTTADTTTPLLAVSDLYAGYRDSVVARELTISLDPGEVVALLGPNGAGKTTVLRTIAGLIPNIRGTVSYRGEVVDSLPAYRRAERGLVLLPDDRGLFHRLSVADNVRLHSVGRDSDTSSIYEWFPALEPLKSRRVGLLSGGEQQMLALGAKLLLRPKVLLIDEMSLGLAPKIVRSLLPLVRSIVEEAGGGIVLVEQQAKDALQIADRAYVMAHGDVVMEGTSEELLERESEIISGYLGQSL